MDAQYGDDDQNQILLAEREAILRQLAELGEDLSDSDEEEENEEEVINPISEESNNSEGLQNPSAVNSEEIKSGEQSPSFEMSVEDCEIKKIQKEEHSNCEEQKNAGDSRTPPIPIQKIVLDRSDEEKMAPLPDGWIIISHQSGMPVYYHKFTRVVTHSRPYQSEGMIRDHEIPISAIPCLHRLKMTEKRRNAENLAENEEKVEKEEKLTAEEYREYCKKRFNFKEITVHRYANPIDRGEAALERKANFMLKKAGFDLDYDQLKKTNSAGEVLLTGTSGITLIDLTPLDANRRGGAKKPFLLNPMGKTTVTVLNEFIQRLVKGTLTYDIEDTRNVTCPYKATATLTMKNSIIKELSGHCRESLTVLCEIAAMSESTSTVGVPVDCKRFAIGRGIGANKKTARLVAARDALSKLIPKLRVSDEHICNGVIEDGNKRGFEEESRELFKKVKIDSQSLVQMCTRFAIPKPYTLLKDAVSRSLRWNGMELKMTKELVGHGSQMSKVTLKLGDMVQEAEAIGVKQATQFASQLLFKQMHPEVLTYGSFLEMYGRFEDKAKMDQAKKQHDEVVRLQDTGNLLQPNYTVLSKLAEEMKAMALIHPPRKFLFGMAPNASGASKNTKSAATQYKLEDIVPQTAIPYAHLQPQMGFPAVRMPAFCPPPGAQFNQQRTPRKRGRLEDSSPPGSFIPVQFPPPPPPSQY